MTLLDYLIKKGGMTYAPAMRAIRYGRVRIGDHEMRNPLAVVPHGVVVTILREPRKREVVDGDGAA